MKNLDVPAFPLNTPEWHEQLNQNGWLGGDYTTGMTLRDYFAAKAMHAIMVPNPVTGQYPQAREFEACAIGAYQMADAMLKAREA